MFSFGYGSKDGELIAVESETEIVKSIFTKYISGKIYIKEKNWKSISKNFTEFLQN